MNSPDSTAHTFNATPFRGLNIEGAGDAESASHVLVDRLLDAAIHDGDRCAFHGASPAPALGEPARWKVFGADYYEGSAGIARALAYAGRLLDRPDALDCARAALRHALPASQGWSLHSGSLGVTLVALELEPWLDLPGLRAQAIALARRGLDQAMADADRGEAGFDLMSGLAGALYAAQELAVMDPEANTAARALATHLLQVAWNADEHRHCWPMHPQDASPLCGFGHGAAGVAFALQRQAGAHALNAAAGAREFEALHFNADACSWADLRAEGGGFPHFWCHGSVGIAIERREALRAAGLSAEAGDRAALDYAAALQGVRREARRLLQLPQGAAAGFELNASQCHGLSGLIDLLLDSGEASDQGLAQRLGACIRQDALGPQSWRCGLPGGESSPGLMLGWAGILWGQLRLLAPREVPLAWAPRPRPDTGSGTSH